MLTSAKYAFIQTRSPRNRRGRWMHWRIQWDGMSFSRKGAIHLIYDKDPNCWPTSWRTSSNRSAEALHLLFEAAYWSAMLMLRRRLLHPGLGSLTSAGQARLDSPVSR